MKLLKNSVVRRLIAIAAVYAVIMYFYMTYFALPLANSVQHQLYETLTNQTYAEQQAEQLSQFLGSQTFFIVSFTFFLVSEIALLIVLLRQR